jgi:DNA-directed RNA polymerase specialized sigma24 family protein
VVDDRTDFTALVRARSAALMRIAVLLTGDSHQAEELLQVSLAKAYLAWGRIRMGPGPTCGASW